VIYWTWNNLLSICQQWYIMQLDKKRQTKDGSWAGPEKPAKAAKKG